MCTGIMVSCTVSSCIVQFDIVELPSRGSSLLTNMQMIKTYTAKRSKRKHYEPETPPPHVSVKTEPHHFNFSFFAGCPLVSASFLFFDLAIASNS